VKSFWFRVFSFGLKPHSPSVELIASWDAGDVLEFTLALIPGGLTRSRSFGLKAFVPRVTNSFRHFPNGSSLPRGEGESFAVSVGVARPTWPKLVSKNLRPI